MHMHTLPRRARTRLLPGWFHPYAVGPWSPLLYADGGEEDGAAPGAEGEDGTPGDTEPEGEGEEGDPEGADALGDPGKKALASMKERLKTERERRRELERQLAESAKPAAKDGEEAGPDAIRRQAESEATARANARIVKAEVKAAAAKKLTDPADALRFIDLEQFEVDEDGEVDAEEVADAIDDLLKRKPYLAAQSGTKRFQGTADSGARKGSGRPSQLTEDDVKRLSKEGKHAEIVKARSEGRLDDYLGLNT
ncbi:hypothetical protein [Streptomyces sp. DH37]|uniref:hypothetical protein n=1 Tax=Streptomyces sp. DH37 TaxID=3040122 RepID=UPI002442F6EB|nr:hypothetical protein [Streptomyces sp. DH37]MDG9705551.1 hypothetical protein [Streptomyces sp. DH37]